MQSPVDVILYAEISQYLCLVDIQKGGLYADGIDLTLPRKIYLVRKNLSWLYNLDPTDDRLIPIANYLYWLCDRWVLIAQNITGSGGAVAPIAGNTQTPYEFIVDASTSFIIDGQSSKTITAFIGFNVIFVRNNITQSTVDLGGGSSYFNWSKSTGLFTIFPAAFENELFQIYPV